MCILCVIQKLSRRVATMLPWLVIPLIGLWALSQLLPPAFRFEITSPRLACVFVLLVTLFWYEILMPQLSAWRVRRNARLRERKRFEAIEMQKLRKTATRRCRNCLTPYRDQSPGGGKFMCAYCGHISKRPVLDLPVPSGLGLSHSGILKDLVGKGGKLLNGKALSDNGWMCGQDWLENGNWVGRSSAGKTSYWQKNGGVFFGGDDHCLTEKSYSRVVTFGCNVLAAFFLGIRWFWGKIFRISLSRDDGLTDAEHKGMLDKQGENGAGYHVSRTEKARRKAEEKRQARLEKELLEEEERKQREEVARLVEERRRLRDEKMEAEKERGKGSPTVGEKYCKKEAEKKHQDRKKERDRGSSKSNLDAEELERKASMESERNRQSGAESVKSHGTELGHMVRDAATNSHNHGNAGTRYLDRMRGTFLSSSRAFTGSGFFEKSANTLATVSREHRSNGSIDHVQISAIRRELSQLECVSGKLQPAEKNINRPVLIKPQMCTAPKKSWHQLFTRSSTVTQPASSNVISRPNGKLQADVQSPPFPGHPPLTQAYDSPLNFGLSSPLILSSFPYGSTSNVSSLPLASESMSPRIGETTHQFLPEESEIFEDPCYVPDPVSLLGPVSESLNNFQLDLGFVPDTGLEKPHALKNIPASSEVKRPSPIESPMSRLRVPEERHSSSFLFPSTSKAQYMHNLPMGDSQNANEKGVWQMWNSSPLGQDALGLVDGLASWILPPEMNRLNKEDTVHPIPQKTMASLFKNDDHVLCGTHSPKQVGIDTNPNGGIFSNVPNPTGDTWLPKSSLGLMSGSETHFSLSPQEETAQNEMIYGSPNGSATNCPFELSPSDSWARKDWTGKGSGEGVGNSSITRPPVGGLYSTPDVQSLWSYD
ncbi:unnamed protein product [Ilex paraguariensis]|uniref:Stress response NST1-like protein n=1 Tax=Ilex paraguariensis TaxID=185542 RepID=A0ABC8SCA0_9AQUA